MIINQLTKNGEFYGHTIWINRKSERIRAKYFASGEVYSKYRNWITDSNKQVVLACSGAFATGYSGNYMPLGITVDNGEIVNRRLHSVMDALVIVYDSGGIAAVDIENEYLNLDGDRVNINNYFDRNKLLNWAVREKATIFQTQLLAHKNRLRLVVKDARVRSRERRILILAKDMSGDVYHIIFNIEKSVYLGDIANDILNYLTYMRNINVFAMLNLDTGIYNILRIYDQYGKELPYIKGPLDITRAINLFVYYYE